MSLNIWKFNKKPFSHVLFYCILKSVYGEVAEWLKAAVLKTVESSRAPWVRIPPSPPRVCFGV